MEQELPNNIEVGERIRKLRKDLKMEKKQILNHIQKRN